MPGTVGSANVGHQESRTLIVRAPLPRPPIEQLRHNAPKAFRRILSNLDIQSLYTAQQVCRDWAEEGLAVSPTVLEHAGLRPLPPPPRTRPDRIAPPVSSQSPLNNHVQCRRYLSHQPLLLTHHSKQDIIAREPELQGPPTLAVAMMKESGGIAVFRDRRIDLYDLGQPGHFNYLDPSPTQRMEPTRTLQYHEVMTPLRRVVLSPTGRFAGLVDNHQTLHLFDIRRDLHRITDVSYPAGGHLAFCSDDTLLIAQKMDGTTMAVPLIWQKKAAFGQAEPLWPHMPVDRIVMASTSASERYLVVVDDVDNKRQARLFRRQHTTRGPWECMGLRSDVQQAWFSASNSDLILQRADGSLQLEVAERSTTQYKRNIEGTLIALHPKCAMAVLYRQDRERTVLLRITSEADPEPLDLSHLLGEEVDGRKLTAKFCADGSALMVRCGRKIWVIQNINDEPVVLRPAGGFFNARKPRERFAEHSQNVNFEITQGGEFLAGTSVRALTPTQLFGLVPAAGPRATTIHLPRPSSLASTPPASPRAPEPPPLEVPAVSQPAPPRSKLSIFLGQMRRCLRRCIAWICELFGHNGICRPKKRFYSWPW